VVKIEGLRSFIQSFYYNTNGRLSCISPASMQGVHQEEAAEILALAQAADGEPAQQSCRKKRIAGKLSGENLRKLAELNAISRQRVVAGNGTILVNHHEGSGALSSGILAGLVAEIVIELRNTRMEVARS